MLRLPPFTYVQPRTIAAAVQALGEHGDDAMLVAGGTDLYPNMKRRQFEPKVLIGLGGVAELRGVRGNAREGFTIGAATTLSSLARHARSGQHGLIRLARTHLSCTMSHVVPVRRMFQVNDKLSRVLQTRNTMPANQC